MGTETTVKPGAQQRLEVALEYAISVIENYQMDIRHSEHVVGIDLHAAGFCQGVAYLGAIESIRRMARGEVRS